MQSLYATRHLLKVASRHRIAFRYATTVAIPMAKTDSSQLFQRLDRLIQEKKYAEAYCLGVERWSIIPMEIAEKVLFGLAESMEWGHLDRMIDSWETMYGIPLSAWSLRTILHKVTGVPDASIFLRYLQRYEAAGHAHTTVTLTLMMLWKIKHKDFDGLTECFNQITEPDFYAYKTYLNGLLRGEMVGEAKRVFFKMVSDGQVTDTVNCSVLIKKLGERGDVEGTKAVLLAMSETQMKIDHIVLADFLTVVHTIEDIKWALQFTNIAPTVECVVSLLESPWAKGSQFDFKYVLGLARSSGAVAERNFYRKLVPIIIRFDAEKQFSVIREDLSSFEWGFLSSSLREFNQYPSDPVEWMQKAVLDALGKNPSLLEPAIFACIHIISCFKRFGFVACQGIIEHLLFQARFELLFDFLDCVHREARLFLPQKTYSRVIQGIGQQGRVELYDLFIRSLKPYTENPEIAAAIDYAEHEMKARFSMDNLTWLIRAGKFDAVKAMLEAQTSTAFSDQLTKMETYSRIGDDKGFAKTVKEMSKLDGSLEALSKTIDNWVENKQLERLLLTGRPTSVLLTVTNAFFNLVSRQATYVQVLKAKNCLFGSEAGLRPNARTYKIYLSSLLHHCEGLMVISPMTILAEMRKIEGFFVDLKLYEQLILLGVKMGDYQEVNGVLSDLVSNNGTLNRAIFSALFEWMRGKDGDLDNTLKLFEMMQGLGLTPPQGAYETVTRKYFEAGQLNETRAWIEKSSEDKTTRVSDQLATDYFHQFYLSNSLPKCEEEMKWLLGLGLKISGDFHVPFLERALEKGDLQMARAYFNLLCHQKAAIRLDLYQRLLDMYLEAGNVNGAHQIHTAMQSAKDPAIRECGRVPFPSLLSTKLGPILERNPAYMLSLKPPACTQNSHLSKHILDLAIKRNLVLSELWCQRVLENLVARGDFEGASNLQLYMIVKGIPPGTEMAAKVASQWRQLASKKPFL